MNKLYYGDNLTVLRQLENDSVDLIYLDPPFNSKRNYNVIFRDAKDHESLDQKTAFKDTWSNINVADMLFEIAGHSKIQRTCSSIAGKNERLFTFLDTLNKLNLDNSTVGYLTTMGIRLIEMHRLLKPTGSIYLHCDPTMSHYLKIVLDMIFGGNNYKNEIVWKRTSAHNDPHKYGNINDILLFYTKTSKYTWNAIYTEY